MAVKMDRFGAGCELSPEYWMEAAQYCRAADLDRSVPDLFETIKEAA
jgi:hypothetical protein